MNTPYGIFQYELNNFCAYISYQTGTNFSYIKQKKQIKYLDNYLKVLAKDSQLCFIYENEYVDKNYLDDFSEYFVNCFSTYKKTTSRIHFFKYRTNSVNLKDEFNKALDSKKSIFNNDNYLGFIVVRPIPKTFLGKVCLEPFYLKETNRLNKHYILKEYNVSLFGIQLFVKSIAFQEQDKILSACATTSLWSFYHAHKSISQISFPSSSEVTKSGYPDLNGYSREFPNNGLSTEMICRSLRSYKLLPEYFEFKKNKKERLQEATFAYASSGIPLILGVNVYNNDNESKGLHAVTVLGYSLESTSISNLIAHSLEKLYVHDDRYGPFTRMDVIGDDFHVKLDENLSTNDQKVQEKYEVKTLILGLYHKIRIPYTPIKNTCLILNNNLKDFVKSLSDIEQSDQDLFINLIDKLKWDISIKQNSDLKNELLGNTLQDKTKHLTKAWPKFLWSAVTRINEHIVFQLLFDATDIEHGNVFIDYLSYTQESEDIRKILHKYAKFKIESSVENNDVLDYQEDDYLNGIIHYFNKEKSYEESLDETFGYLKIPKRIDENEINCDIINDSKIFRENFNNNHNFKLQNSLPRGSQYIWLIDKEGFLCIGIEDENTQLGHPTLTNGMPARIGGELKYISEDNKQYWEINSKSGRYSSEYLDKDEKAQYLQNALEFRFTPLFIGIEFKCKDESMF